LVTLVMIEAPWMNLSKPPAAWTASMVELILQRQRDRADGQRPVADHADVVVDERGELADAREDPRQRRRDPVQPLGQRALDRVVDRDGRVLELALDVVDRPAEPGVLGRRELRRRALLDDRLALRVVDRQSALDQGEDGPGRVGAEDLS
jgi:hypothetical protein